ncbi:N-acetylmuramoyl-L-alanine amidase AmiB precursor [Pediococcus damnosus]|uniref:glucosaminidase domain-containing protein n=1 Tax=Pediococcus damnosus TaxID=51663 RepID=UPI00078C6495|nr:glucosaminidase domain-containing protein [Pediococcus damnosus]AMV69064.1 N-acetylmuramoyl-L-alanine amidase AmiB precursor [Pediococcus damnosus]
MHKRWVPLVSFLILLSTIAVWGSNSKTVHADSPQSFISRLKPDVQSVSTKYNLYGSLMMAQAACESAWGQSQLAIKGNNYFGIKGTYQGKSITMRTAEYTAGGQLYYTNAAFRKYPNVKASLNDNGNVLRNGTAWNSSFYKGTWKENASTPEAAANYLTGRYATAPSYAKSLISIIKGYNLHSLLDGVSVKYTKQNKSMQVKLSPGHDFYNHIPGSTYSSKRTHYGSTYKGKTITIDNSGVKKGTKTPYYRCYYNGKLIGWIYSSAVVNVTKYTSTYKVASVSTTPKNDFYNHVTSSVYSTKRLHYGTTYRGQNVTIDNQAVRVGTKTPYYRCYVNGKLIGWVYGGALTNVRYLNTTYTSQTLTRKVKAVHPQKQLWL